MAKLTFLSDICKGCGLCVTACPKKILEMDTNTLNRAGHHPVKCVDASKCIACTSCAIICPDCAITIEKDGE